MIDVTFLTMFALIMAMDVLASSVEFLSNLSLFENMDLVNEIHQKLFWI